jgi:hypothetical protein
MAATALTAAEVRRRREFAALPFDTTAELPLGHLWLLLGVMRRQGRPPS